MLPAASTWFTATVAHILLTFRTVWRIPGLATLDDRIWVASVASVGILAFVVHGLAATVGLSLPGGVLLLGAVHLALARFVRRGPDPNHRLTWQEVAAVAAWAALALTWLVTAAASAEVFGTDAASYHAPHAVNIARGARVFDLPATQHLYPQLAAAMGAWFVLPFAGPTVIEVSMLLPLLLVATSINLIFRQATDLSGLAWTSWLAVALLGVPLFRFSMHLSADLWFTAGYLSVLAALLKLWSAREWSRADLLAGATAAGILLGSKTTGVAALGLLVIVWVGLLAGRWIVGLHRPRLPGRPMFWGTAMAVVAIGAGGIWLIRNWLLFGSPLAPSGLTLGPLRIFPGEPLQNSQLLSVLFDLQADDYVLADRAAFYLRRWVGRWYVPAVCLIFLVPLDAFVGQLRGCPGEISRRLVLLALTTVPGGILVWLLIGAPWTSLEWTQGFALRYALPVIVSLLVLAFVALFTVAAPWYQAPGPVALASAGVIGASCWMFWQSLSGAGPRFTPWPTVAIPWIAAGAVLAVVLPRLRPKGRTAAWMLLVLVAGMSWTPVVARTTEANQQLIEATVGRFAGPSASLDPHDMPLAAVVAYETAAGRPCERRRFFVLSRFDQPLRLQDPHYRSIVFYAGRDPALLTRYGPIGQCDYVITTPPVLGTDRGWTMLATLAGGRPLRRLPGSGQFVTFAPTGSRD
jgi:hypothetical protein